MRINTKSILSLYGRIFLQSSGRHAKLKKPYNLTLLIIICTPHRHILSSANYVDLDGENNDIILKFISSI